MQAFSFRQFLASTTATTILLLYYYYYVCVLQVASGNVRASDLPTYQPTYLSFSLLNSFAVSLLPGGKTCDNVHPTYPTKSYQLTYPTLPYSTLLYLTLPYSTLLYLALPYLTLPYSTLPYLTLPYLTLPYL